MNKVIIFDNEDDNDVNFVRKTLNTNGYDCHIKPIPQEINEDSDKKLNEIIDKLSDYISREGPNIIIVDIALRNIEEDHLRDNLIENLENDYLTTLSGFSIAKALKEFYPNIPIILMSKFPSTPLLMEAIKLACDAFICKVANKESIISTVTECYSRRYTHDYILKDKILNMLSLNETLYKNEVIKKGIIEYTKQAPSLERRLYRLIYALNDLLNDICADEIVSVLIERLIHGEILLETIDFSRRNHILHSSNVFFLGYYLIHQLHCFKDFVNERQHIDFNFEKIVQIWSLASLFHDVGYIKKYPQEIYDKVKNLIDQDKEETINYNKPDLGAIYDFLNDLGTDGKLLVVYLKEILAKWGKKISTTNEKVFDHGIQSASDFLQICNSINNNGAQIDDNIKVRVATAIALHNYPFWPNDWLKPDDNDNTIERAKLPFAILPISSLLIVVDNIQTWEREPETDPVLEKRINPKSIMERIEKDMSLPLKSNLISLDISDDKKCVELCFGFPFAQGKNIKDICETMITKMKAWKKNNASIITKYLELSDKVKFKLKYILPGRLNNPFEITI